MTSKRVKLYVFLSIACATGYIWLFFNLLSIEKHSLDVCLFKRVTHLPCPSCGTTRSVSALLNGNFMEAIFINPLGLVMTIALVVITLWLIFDFIMQKSTLFDFYYYLEKTLRKPFVAIPLILLILLNWIWNISKGL